MSDLLVHWAVFEDARRLAMRDPGMDRQLAAIMEEQREFARLGAISRGGGWWVPHILKTARQQWETAADRSSIEKRLAFALGGITHYAADKVMKPVMRTAIGNDPDKKVTPELKPLHREVSAYFDVHVFREVYLAGHEEPFNQFLLQHNDTAPGEALELLVRSLFQRALLSSHTFDPDKGLGEGWSGNFDAWLDHLFARIQPLYIDINLYAGIFAHPDPAKMQQYGVTTSFYDKTDPIIAAARALQHGQRLPDHTLLAALTPDTARSAYGRILQLTLSRLRDTTAFWQHLSDTPPEVSQ